MKPIVVATATCREISLLAEKLGVRDLGAPQPFRILEAAMGERPVILAVTGIGKVNTAACLTAILSRRSCEMVISTGCAGAFVGCGMAVGELVTASSEVFADEGVITPNGWKSMKEIGIPLVEQGETRYYNELPLSLTATAKAVQLGAALGLRVHRGKSVTVSTCSGTLERGEQLRQRYRAVSENMEGAAAAHVALLYGVDCLEVRGISNLVEDRNLSRWDIPLAVEAVQRFLFKFIETI